MTDNWFDIDQSVIATSGYDTYQRIFTRWANDRMHRTTGYFPLLRDYVQANYPDVFNKARAYARVMGEI